MLLLNQFKFLFQPSQIFVAFSLESNEIGLLHWWNTFSKCSPVDGRSSDASCSHIFRFSLAKIDSTAKIEMKIFLRKGGLLLPIFRVAQVSNLSQTSVFFNLCFLSLIFLLPKKCSSKVK
jgi:hypothetical protein